MRYFRFIIFALAVSSPFLCIAQTQVELLLDKAQSASGDPAIDLYDSAATLAHANGDSSQYLVALTRWGKMVLEQRDPQRVLSRFDSVDYTSFGLLEKPLYDFLKVFNTSARMLKLDTKVLEISKEVLALNEKLYEEPNVDRVDFTYYVGMMQANLFIRDKGLENIKKALELSIQLFGEESERSAILHNNVGITYKSMGDYDNALIYYQKTVELLRAFDSENYRALATLTNNVSGVLLEKRSYAKALEVNQQAIELNNKAARKNPSMYFKRGQIYQEIDSNRLALQNFRSGYKILVEIVPEGHPALWNVISYIGSAHLSLAHYDSAEYYFDKVISSQKINSHEMNPYVFDSYVGKGNLAIAKDNFDKGFKHYNQAIKHIVPDYEVESGAQLPNLDFVPFDYLGMMLNTALLNKGQALYKKGMSSRDEATLKQALEHFELGIDVYRKQINAAISESQKLALSQNKQSNYREAVITCFELYRLTNDDQYMRKAHDVIESNKAFIMYQNRAVAQGSSTYSLPDSLRMSINKLTFDIDENRRKYRDLLAAESDSLASSLRDTLIEQQLQLETLNKSVRENFSAYFEFNLGIKGFSLEEVRSILPSKTVLLQYYEASETSYYVLAISKSNLTFKKIELDEELSRDFIQNNHSNQSYELYTKLIKPLEKILDGKTNLIVMPDGKTNLIPFEILISSQSNLENDPDYLIKKYDIRYHYSSNLLMLTREVSRNKNKKNLLAYAPEFDQASNALLATRSAADSALVKNLVNLPEAQIEAQNITNIFSGELKTGNDATETHFKQNAADYGTLHLATHALVNNENPMFSRLVFSNEGDSTNDGLLHTYELYNMKLNADLVSLSACNTGVGKYYKGEGVMSLARGFMYAGVPNVMTSLWSVPDKSTSEIMTSFYKHLKNGMGKAEALRQAKLDYLKTADKNTSAPYYWAGFVYIGTVEEDKQSSNLWIGLVMAMIVTSIVLFVNKRRKAYARKG